MAHRADVLTRVGPGTPMGEFMRQYWVPAVMSSELTPDGDPLRLRLLGEDLIAFRTTSGAVGIMDHRCAHRCASLFYGRIEHDGIRCVYHGWKFTADGACVDQPNVDEGRITARARAYRTVERAGIVWAYLGKRAEPPPLPAFAALAQSQDRLSLWCEQRECNWLQCVEGELDTSHAGFLHLGSANAQEGGSNGSALDTQNRAVRYKVEDTPYGVLAGGYRPGGPERTYWRFANFLFPFWTQPPPCPLGTEAVARAWVPMDDTHTMNFALSTDTFSLAQGPRAIYPPVQPGFSFVYEFLPNTTDWYGRWRLASNASNDYRIDRDVQRSGSFTGIEGLDIQDMAMQESMGAIVDRDLETLVAADLAVTRTRKRLIDAVRAFAEHGAVPPGVDDPQAYARAWNGYILAPSDRDWLDVYRGATPSGVEPFAAAAEEVAYGN